MNGKCPKCEAVVSRAIVNTLTLDVIGGVSYAGVEYSCPQCRTILGMQIDPVQLKTDTVMELAAFLRKG